MLIRNKKVGSIVSRWNIKYPSSNVKYGPRLGILTQIPKNKNLNKWTLLKSGENGLECAL